LTQKKPENEHRIVHLPPKKKKKTKIVLCIDRTMQEVQIVEKPKKKTKWDKWNSETIRSSPREFASKVGVKEITDLFEGETLHTKNIHSPLATGSIKNLSANSGSVFQSDSLFPPSRPFRETLEENKNTKIVNEVGNLWLEGQGFETQCGSCAVSYEKIEYGIFVRPTWIPLCENCYLRWMN
jgi:hypothetical protein